FEEAMSAVREALRLRPDFCNAICNLGNIHQAGNRQEEAAAAFQRALALNPAYLEPINNLGVALKELALPEQALAVYGQGMKAHPDNAVIHGNWLNTLNFLPNQSAEEVFSRHVQWGIRHARPLARTHRPHGNDRAADRMLRIGYLSPDLRQHSVAFFLIGLLENHDRSAFQAICYSTRRGGDAVTRRIEAACGPVRDLCSVGDDAAAEMIRRDGIDILVDLAGHTAYNGLAIMARKPAPVQVTWLGYPNTTGVEAIDWRLTDAHADPAGAERFHTEKLFRLPRTAWCFTPLSGLPPVAPSSRQSIVFGCFGDLAKMNAPLLQLWSTILHQVPQSRLIIKHRATGNRSVVRRFLAHFESLGISPDRLDMIPPCMSQEEHLQKYAAMDIALDTYPYHGTTTTCESLWMGVPVVTLAGQSHASRVGVSLLTNVGLPDVVARSEQDYVRIATSLAFDRNRLAELQSTMRRRMQSSALMDAGAFARDVEAAYRSMWRSWTQGV
ncbi:MAG TPA: tetratricopeptide repeat protein, partial [Tepidisphaeraceae bacterium]|nr:tetratricopeptide repeat protein [Tepidisphaeraceae bacterium]